MVPLSCSVLDLVEVPSHTTPAISYTTGTRTELTSHTTPTVSYTTGTRTELTSHVTPAVSHTAEMKLPFLLIIK
jgi:hypothetical protein